MTQCKSILHPKENSQFTVKAFHVTGVDREKQKTAQQTLAHASTRALPEILHRC